MDDVLWLKPCSAVHTLGMRVSLTLLFLNDQQQLVRIVPKAQPGRIFVCWQASSVIEMRARPEPDIIEAWHHISSRIFETQDSRLNCFTGLSKNANVGRIKTRVQNAANRDVDRHLKGRSKID